MAISHDPIFAQGVDNFEAVCTAAKTTYNDTTGAVLLYTAPADGALVTRLKARPRLTVTATQLQLYRSPDAGTTLYLVDSVLMAAYTMAQTTAIPATDFAYTSDAPLKLGAAERLYAAIGVAAASPGVVFEGVAEPLTAPA